MPPDWTLMFELGHFVHWLSPLLRKRSVRNSELRRLCPTGDGEGLLVVLGFARDWLHIAIRAAYVARSMKAGFSSGRSFLKTFHFGWRFA
jgi:hypothetical protein